METTTKKNAPAIPIEAFTGENNLTDAEKKAEKEKQDLKAMQNLIAACKINLTEKLSPPPVAMQIKSAGERITLFTKGNFSIVTGPAKSRKTFLVSMLIAASIKGVFEDLFFCPANGINLIFDTEQSRYKTQQIAKRICTLAGQPNPANLQVYSLRTLHPAERIDLIESVLQSTANINFVAIDGIIDLDIDPILQAEQAQNIVSKLMKWTEIYNIHIVCVLHYNKTVATLLGHLGSFSHRKADAIISVTKSKEDENISLVEAVDCREKEFMPFAFSVGENGMPYILEGYSFEKTPKERKGTNETKLKGISPNSLEQQHHADILNYVFNIQKAQAYNELWRNIKNAIETVTGKTIGDNKAKDFLSFYVNNESVIRTDSGNKKNVYTIAGQRAIEFQ
jgi:hypothetical protein